MRVSGSTARSIKETHFLYLIALGLKHNALWFSNIKCATFHSGTNLTIKVLGYI